MKNIVLSELPVVTRQSDGTTLRSVLIAAIKVPFPVRLVGTVQVIDIDNPSPCLLSLCVDQQYRRQGIGRALTIRAIAIAQEQSTCTSVWLSTSKENREAIAMYNALGFVETGPCKANGIYMQKEIRS